MGQGPRYVSVECMESFCFSIYIIKSDQNKMFLLFVSLSYKDIFIPWSVFCYFYCKEILSLLRKHLFFSVRKTGHFWNHHAINSLVLRWMFFLFKITTPLLDHLFMKYSDMLIHVCDALRPLTLFTKQIRSESSRQVRSAPS